MTQFTDDNLYVSSGYITYHPNGIGKTAWEDRKFIARLKTGETKSWISFLKKNFTAEEYLARYDAGETPLVIMESKGYLLPHVKRWMKQAGFPLTKEGHEQYMVYYSKKLDEAMQARKARMAA